jgi:hypothetical protein
VNAKEHRYRSPLSPDDLMYELRGSGPLLVTMDAHGKSMYTEVEKKKKAALRKIKTDLLSSQLEPS